MPAFEKKQTSESPGLCHILARCLVLELAPKGNKNTVPALPSFVFVSQAPYCVLGAGETELRKMKPCPQEVCGLTRWSSDASVPHSPGGLARTQAGPRSF